VLSRREIYCELLAVETVRGKRDRAILALLIACGLRRAELVGLKKDDFQLREDHWVLADLVGNGKHIRTVSCARVGEERRG